MSLILIALGVFIAFQFADGISSYLMLSQPGAESLHGITFWLQEKIGPAGMLVVTKVLIIIIAIALYIFLHIPWWVYAIGIVVYLWKTGRALYLWRDFVKNGTGGLKTEEASVKSNVESAIKDVEARASKKT